MSGLRQAAIEGFLVLATFVTITASATACSFVVASGANSSGPEATAVAVEASQARERRIELAEEVVRNGKYELPGVGAFQLKDGNYQERYGEGASQIKKVGVVAVTFGDIDGDKVEDAVVVLWANTGGSGTFMYLAPMLDQNGKGEQVGAELLGDRVQIKSLRVDAGKIKVDVLAQGRGDAMVAPSLDSEIEYALRDGKLARLTPLSPVATPVSKATSPSLPTAAPSPMPTERPSSVQASAGLLSTIWIWQRFVDTNEKGSFVLPYPAAYRLELLPDGKFQIQADCNRGSGGYYLEGSRLALTHGPLTRAQCPPGSKHDQYLSMLGQVATYVLKGDTLYLNLRADAGDMVFSRLSAVTGTIVGLAGETVPSGSTAEIMIVNGAGAQVGGSIVKAALPMEFEAPFKPATVDTYTSYKLEVTIKDAQKNVVFRNARPYAVLTGGNPTYHLQVEVERAN